MVSTVMSEWDWDGRKPYVCDYPGCGKRFRRNYNVQVHMRTHTNEEPFHCPSPGCGKTFKWRSTLKTHCSFKHGIELPSTENCLVKGTRQPASRQPVSSKGEASEASEATEPRREEPTDDGGQKFYTQFVFRESLRPQDLPEGDQLIQCDEEGCDFYFNSTEFLELHRREHVRQRAAAAAAGADEGQQEDSR